MLDIKDHFKAERLKAIIELEKNGTDAYLPANAWGFDLSAIDRADMLPSTKTGYKRELRALLKTGISPSDFEGLQKYTESLKPTHKTRLKRALRLVTMDIKERATPDNFPVIQALIMRLETMHESVNDKAKKESSSHIWLSPLQVQEITSLCGNDLEGKRDWIILALLLGAGLRRGELVKMTFDSLRKERTKNGKTRDVLQVTGYSGKDREVPIAPLLAKRLREWNKIVGGGYVARSYDRKELGKSISGVSVHQIVRKYGAMIGVPNLKTDDLLRTYAQLAYDSGIPPIHIKKLMGHERLSTTQRHLNLKVDLDDISGDFVPLKG